MEKLTFEHLTGYLPYGLKVEYSGITNLRELSDWKKQEPKDFYTKKGDEYMDWANRKPNEIYGSRISEIKQIEVYKKYILLSVGKKYGYYKKVGISQIKPVLRPLSDLTKEEWLRVFRSCFSKEALEVMEQINLDVYLKPNSGTVWLYDVDKGMSFIVPKDYFIAYSSNSKSIGFTRGYCFDTLKFFKELYKLHADLDGLIEKGLAIDINTLKSELK